MRGILLFVLALAALDAAAQAWPSRPTRLIIGNSAGSGPDVTARLFAEAMSRRLGQPWVVENRPGGEGDIGTMALVPAAPDGYTLKISTQTQTAIDMHTRKSMPYDPDRDFTYVAVVVDETSGMAVAVHPSLPVRTLQELAEMAKSQPGKLSVSTTQSYGTMFGQWFRIRAGAEMVEVRYKQASQAIQDVISGRVPVAFQSPGALGPQVRSGKMRFLATATARRLQDFPDVPTVAEAYPGFSMRGFMILIGPAGLPREIVTRLNQEAGAVVKDPKFLGELAKIYWFNFEGARTPEGTAEFVREQRRIWGAFIKQIGLQPS
jgi:tripartite-type tricarboxylate transporter receptor subunit TctC